MKLRTIRLENVRQFAGKVMTVSDLGDGLNVISAPNEFGKSTLFDALQAVFLQPFGAANADVKSLQPQPGEGGVSVSVEVEIAGRSYRIDKRFLSRKQARITDLTSGAILAQDGAADIWLDSALGKGGIKGPSGLLWVRQGGGDFDWSPKAKDDADLSARRNILSTVAGEIDLVTGGRRFDLVLQRTEGALGALQTARTGKPTGDWDKVLKAIAGREAEVAELTAQVADLRSALDRRRQAEVRLAVLEAGAAVADRRQALDLAKAGMQAAQDHARLLEEAATKAALADAHLREAAVPLTTLIAAARQAETALAAHIAADASHAAAIAARQGCTDRLSLAETAFVKALALRDALRRQDSAARDRAVREAAQSQATALADRLTQADAARQAAEAARAEATANLVTPERLARADQAEAACQQAARTLAATGIALQVDYLGQGRLGLNGQDLPPGLVRLRGGSVIDVPGLARLTVQADGADDSAARAGVDRATGTLAEALRAMEQPDLPAARLAAQRRAAVMHHAATQAAVLTALAPQGLDTLRADLVRAMARIGGGDDDVGHADAVPPEVIAAAEAALVTAETARTDARTDAESVMRELGKAQTEAELAGQALTRAAQARGDLADLPERQAALRATATGAQQAATRAADTLAALKVAAPDLATAKAELDRTASAAKAADVDVARLREARAGLNADIAARAEAGVEQALAEAQGDLASLQARADALAAEAAALACLRDALTQARGAAREAYFGPVQDELRPLLAILHGEAALDFDPDRMLPRSLTRAGTAQPEAMQTLSAGTQEQIAILIRLAFARLLARQGRPVPVILDDALVHSDDARIIAMFRALHRVAAEQQIIVLSCRQLAFAQAGGHHPTITILPVG